jgi:hypothetical protein
MISMNLIRRVVAMTGATVMAALVTIAASACGGATTATGPMTNGLEKIDFSEYNAPLHITAPPNPIDVSNAG